jgi:hypothetical protein
MKFRLWRTELGLDWLAQRGLEQPTRVRAPAGTGASPLLNYGPVLLAALKKNPTLLHMHGSGIAQSSAWNFEATERNHCEKVGSLNITNDESI